MLLHLVLCHVFFTLTFGKSFAKIINIKHWDLLSSANSCGTNTNEVYIIIHLWLFSLDCPETFGGKRKISQPDSWEALLMMICLWQVHFNTATLQWLSNQSTYKQIAWNSDMPQRKLNYKWILSPASFKWYCLSLLKFNVERLCFVFLCSWDTGRRMRKKTQLVC